jgi:molybdopterin-guanine dinucleotide biosynthesis protein A
MLDAIILAGGDPARDAELLAHAGGNAPCKALIELGDKTFLERITDALLGSGHVRRMVIAGLESDQCPSLGPHVAFLPDAGSMLNNGQAGLDFFRSTGEISERIVVSSADVPLITSEIVRDILDADLRHDADFCYNIVEQETMEKVFPGSGRTFVPVKGGRFAGGDLNLISPSILGDNRSKVEEIIGERKTFWKQIRAVGLGTLFLLLIGQLTIDRTERQVGKALGFSAKAIVCPHAEVAMDVDKPHHLDVVRTAWVERHREQAG